MSSKFEALALSAKKYSRSQILEGATQLQNNSYHIIKQKHLREATSAVRKMAQNEEFSSGIDSAIILFANRISACKKFSLGNCFEYALLALEYVVENQSDVNAEVFEIKGGDHVFLVIGRTKWSNPQVPTSLGNEAYICDPWSDSVYPAKDYMDKTKNFFFTISEDGRQINHTQNFNPKMHKMNPIHGLNSTQILKGSLRLKKEMFDCFIKTNEKYCAILDDLAKDLDRIANNLSNKYGDKDQKVLLIRDKIKVIRNETARIREAAEHNAKHLKSNISSKKYQSHQKVKYDLKQKMKNQFFGGNHLGPLSIEERAVLNQYRNKGSFITMLMMFLHIKPTSSRKYKASMEKAEEKLSRTIQQFKL